MTRGPRGRSPPFGHTNNHPPHQHHSGSCGSSPPPTATKPYRRASRGEGRGGSGSSLSSSSSPPPRVCALVMLSCLCLFTVGTLMRVSVLTAQSLSSSSLSLDGNNPLESERSRSQRIPDTAAERAKRRAALRNRLRLRGGSDKEDRDRGAAVSRWQNDKHSDSSFQFNYSQVTVPNSFTLTEPRLFQNETVIVLVLSARNNFDRRRAIRETWGRDHPVYFVVGGPILPPGKGGGDGDLKAAATTPSSGGVSDTTTAALANTTVQQQQRSLANVAVTTSNLESQPSLSGRALEVQRSLIEEQARHRDMIDSIHPDSYRSLTHKVRFGYGFVLDRIPAVEWLVKVDDDTVVRVDTLAAAFLRNFNPKVPMVIGRIIENSHVPRSGKWADELYPHARYPYWPQGSCGHVVSRPVAEFVSQAEGLVYYQGEDISIGIWLDESDLQTTWVHSEYFSNDRKCLKHAWLIMGHEVTEREMRECYDRADEWPIEDVTHKHRRYWKVSDLRQQPELELTRFGGPKGMR